MSKRLGMISPENREIKIKLKERKDICGCVPDRNSALSTVCSSAKRMWQKFFLLLRMALIAPHCSNTSDMICSVAFSGRPPTNTVLQPGGLSRVAGGGRSVKHKRVHTYRYIWSHWKWLAKKNAENVTKEQDDEWITYEIFNYTV